MNNRQLSWTRKYNNNHFIIVSRAYFQQIPLRQDAGKGPRWDLTGTEGCGGGIMIFSPMLMFSGYMDIYRRKEGIGGARGGPRGWRARPRGVDAPPASYTPWSFLDAHCKSPGSRLLRKSRPQRFHSVWTSFDIPFLRNPEIGKKTAICTGPLG